MKKLTLTLAIVCAACALTYAGSEEKLLQPVAPAPPPCPTWTGFYIGGDVGYKHVDANLDLDLFASWDTVGNEEDRAEIMNQAPSNLESDTFEAGGFLGYNAQIGSFVIGGEVSGNYVGADENAHSDFIVPHPLSEDSDISLRTSFDSHYLMTVAPRVGFAICRFMPYATGGLAIGQIKYSQDIDYNNPAALDFHQGGGIDKTAFGWMVGGGLQYAFTDHWSARLQYQYIDLGSHDFRTEGSPDFGGFFEGEHSISVTEHNASFGIMYKF